MLIGTWVAVTGCSVGLRRVGDEIRRQQLNSEPFGESADSRRKGARPTRAIVHSAAHDAADGLVDGLLSSASDPVNSEKMTDIKDRANSSVREITNSAGQGAIEGVNAQLPALQGSIVRIVKGIKADLNLDIERTIRNGVRAGIEEAKIGLADEALVARTRTLIADGVVAGMRQGLDDHLLADMKNIKTRVAADLAPAAEELTRAAVRGATQQLTYELAVDGDARAKRLGPALVELVERSDAVLGERAESVTQRGFWIALLVVVFAALVLGILFAVERVRKHAAMSRQQKVESMLRLVAQAIRTAAQPGAEREDGLSRYRSEVKRIGRDGSAESRDTYAELNAFLTREQLKL